MGFLLEIITPRGIYSTEEVDSLTVKLGSGYRTFLKGHVPLIGSLAYAPMHLVKNGKFEEYAVHGGAINVTKEKICLVCNAIENKKEIDKARALAAKERAEKRLKDKDPNIDLKRAQLALQRALIRLELAGKD
jgi:F-type H+-transporting ATPase subunit epsilon